MVVPENHENKKRYRAELLPHLAKLIEDIYEDKDFESDVLEYAKNYKKKVQHRYEYGDDSAMAVLLYEKILKWIYKEIRLLYNLLGDSCFSYEIVAENIRERKIDDLHECWAQNRKTDFCKLVAAGLLSNLKESELRILDYYFDGNNSYHVQNSRLKEDTNILRKQIADAGPFLKIACWVNKLAPLLKDFLLGILKRLVPKWFSS